MKSFVTCRLEASITRFNTCSFTSEDKGEEEEGRRKRGGGRGGGRGRGRRKKLMLGGGEIVKENELERI